MSDSETFSVALPSGDFNYTGANIDNLESSEYTVARIVFDESGSTSGFSDEMNKVAGEIVRSCGDNPRADNMLLGIDCFGSRVREAHGFKELKDCNPGDYSNLYRPGGMTALNDATVKAVKAVGDYGRQLAESQYMCNGIIFIVTDGCENGSSEPISEVKKALEKVVKDENLESLVTILIGVGTGDGYTSQTLQDFKDEVGITEYIALDDASQKNLAKLAKYISQSISSQSQALGSGGPSTSLTF